MPESKATPTPEVKKQDAAAKAPSTPPSTEQKSPTAAQSPQVPKTTAPVEKKQNDPPKEPSKAPPAPPTTPPPPPPKAPPKKPEDKGKPAAEPKQAEVTKPPADGKKPTVAEKPVEKKPDAKDAAPVPKAVTPTEPKEQASKKPEEKAPATDPKPKAPAEPKKPGDKATPGGAAKGASAVEPKKNETAPPVADGKGKPATDPKKPEDKAPAADPKGKPVDTPKKENPKTTITVSGKDKVEISVEPTAPTTATVAETPLTPAQKGGQTRKERNQAAKNFFDGKTTIDGKPIEPLKSVPAGNPKNETAKGPEQDADGPKGIVITQVYDDRLAPPTDADLKNLPIPKEGEAFSMRLHPAYFFEFLEHPFTINRETKDYKDLRESIKENGIRDPVYCRPREKGGLEIISGHRRHDIGTELNYPIPTIIVQADDDTARIAVVDGNLHRMDIPTSELARAAKMKMEALTRKAGRRSKMDHLAAPQKRSDQQVADDMGMSRNQVQRLVRIDSLVPELKQQVDDKKLPFNTAVELSYMKPDEQKKVVDFMAKEQVTPSMAQATALKEASKHAETLAKHTPSLAPAHAVDEKKIESIIKPKKEPELKVTLTASELSGYFPDKKPTVAEAKRVIFDALDMRKKALEKQAKKQDIKNPAR